MNSRHYAGAYYLLGYSVECALKSCIAKQFRGCDFPDKKLVNDSYTHNLEQLLGLAGLRNKLDLDRQQNPDLDINWTIVKDWSEQSRYENSISESRVRDFYSACTARNNGILTWLRNWW